LHGAGGLLARWCVARDVRVIRLVGSPVRGLSRGGILATAAPRRLLIWWGGFWRFPIACQDRFFVPVTDRPGCLTVQVTLGALRQIDRRRGAYIMLPGVRGADLTSPHWLNCLACQFDDEVDARHASGGGRDG
jgi:hypothetical protein